MRYVPSNVHLLAMSFVIVVLLNFQCYVEAFSDPYKVLQVSRIASKTEIKRNYKSLVRQW